MFVYSAIPTETVRVLAIPALGVAALSSVFVFFLSFVRFWRYLFFPNKENFLFFGECIAHFLLVIPQLVFYLYQARQLAYPDVTFVKDDGETIKVPNSGPKYRYSLYKNAVYVLFFHDFLYSTFFYNLDRWYAFIGYTQFITHSLMAFMPNDKPYVGLFSIVWTGLFVQHILLIIATFTDEALSDSKNSLRLLTGVYIVSVIIYLLNAGVLFELDPLKPFRKVIDKSVETITLWWNQTFRRGGSSRLSKSKLRKRQ